ncbi:hypothetical protein [Pedobacter sp. BMA]|uniref:hypothetical protein n=1 Tax=Pedobacter sp. BMA TaxID=1663685 RepID=UPI00064AD3A2|nr:hypothetical protein [Pedobacter sp. BMA]KLT64035.1 hypothetical protein AB669_18395 [Pedobacter sp. BMA]
MQFELTPFEENFRELISNNTFSRKYKTDFEKNVDREYERLIYMFRNLVFKAGKNSEIKRYVYMHQQVLTALADAIEKAITSDIEHPNKSLLNILYSYIRDLLEWLSVELRKYFDFSYKAPIYFMTQSLANIKNQQEMLTEKFKQLDFSEDFITMFKKATDVSYVISFTDIYFWLDLYDIIHKKILENLKTDEYEIIKLMIETGANHDVFFSYVAKFIANAIDGMPLIDDQITMLRHFREDFKCSCRKRPEKQYSDNKSSRKLINTILKQKIRFLELLKFVKDNSEDAQMMNSQYKVSFSVKQLAFFIHLQMETGIILWRRAKFAPQYVSHHYSTIERESISEKSVRNALYNHAGEDIKKVIVKLTEMLELAKGKY